ncbi:MAG: hypothetical protein COV57_03370 [Candidatus Liptonbacteria bacterium CG11_big_fil_rev_8_21_14_0_20_35_14]|uniref:HAD family hydrolase n=1 Tax=Candidatus Liptonbacteria bacterium CG11_big_fil_rev_8_21_14_0_20_35_14 TaxID=1974634 RepID=A0A2H0N6X6_9BACT|nr:MAG: hypothetical protein COV57_03370 [Candidatus Liptonbacteria bacterium CG11_big_fil_rev_8_21_14_0_20_35_14]
MSLYFDEVIISAEVGINKPDPKIYSLALDKIKSNPEESIFIDDLEKNLEPAKKLGIATILYENPKQLEKNLSVYL